MVDMTKNTTEKKLTQSDIRGVFIRSNLFQGSWNFERMQALGFCFSMVPAIRRLYPENNDARKQAIKRHLEFFNTHPYVAAPVLGVTLAMEEQRANGAEIDDGAINGIKVGLMGPLAGVGDPIFWGTLRPITAALGASFALSGSILGLFVMGALVNKWTSVNIPVVVSSITNAKGEVVVTTVQTILDQLMPGLVPLLMTFACMALLKRKVNAIWIIFGLFAVGIICYALGIMNVK